MVGPQAKRQAAEHLISVLQFRAQKAIKLVGLESSTFYYKNKANRDDAKVIEKLTELFVLGAKVRALYAMRCI